MGLEVLVYKSCGVCYNVYKLIKSYILQEVIEMENEAVKIEVGNKISALGHIYEVGKILFQDAYMWYPSNAKENDEKVPTYDIEFLDPRGGYHHWKSNLDGGRVIR
jgi:hypothetical protein